MQNPRLSFIFMLVFMLSSCSRDLASDVYTSSSTLSLTLKGQVISAREVVVREHDRLGENETGMVAGGLAGGALGRTISNKKNGGVLAGALIGAAVGAIGQKVLSKTKGYEYIVQVDTSELKKHYYDGSKAMRAAVASATTSGLVTVLQGRDKLIPEGSKVYVIFSDSRTRIVPIN